MRTILSSKKVKSIKKSALYKAESLEALQNSKSYKTTREMMADAVNW